MLVAGDTRVKTQFLLSRYNLVREKNNFSTRNHDRALHLWPGDGGG